MNKSILLRLLKLSWNYRSGCLRAIILQVLLIASAVAGLTLIGIGIDYLHHFVRPESKAPAWPLGLRPPAEWSTMTIVLGIAAINLAVAGARYLLSYHYSLTIVRLLQQGIVVDLRARVYEKMQKLSFRFFDSRTSGTLINRVTVDVQSVRLFIDGVIIQGVTIVISVVVYLAYMLTINAVLTAICLATAPLMWLVSVYFSRKLKAAYERDRNNVDRMVLDLVERVHGVHVVKGFAREPE